MAGKKPYETPEVLVHQLVPPGVIHRLSFCQVCDAQYDLFSDPDGRKKMYQHIRDTGHKVTVETGSSCTYGLKE